MVRVLTYFILLFTSLLLPFGSHSQQLKKFKFVNSPFDSLRKVQYDWLVQMNDSLNQQNDVNTLYNRSELRSLQQKYAKKFASLISDLPIITEEELIDRLKTEVNDLLNTEKLGQFKTENSLARYRRDFPLLQKLNQIKAQSLDSLQDKLNVQGVLKQISPNEQILDLDRNNSFWKHFSFDGIVGVSTGPETFYQLSPAILFELVESIHIGAGPQFNINREFKSYLPTGLRGIIKKELGSTKAYLQGEYVRFAKDTSAEIPDMKNPILLGGGYKIPLGKGKTTLNSSLLFNFKSSAIQQRYLFRIGLSSPLGKQIKR